MMKQLLAYAPEVVFVFPDTFTKNYMSVWEPYLRACTYRCCVTAKTLANKDANTQLPVFTTEMGFKPEILNKVPSVKMLLYPTNRPNCFGYFYRLPQVKHIFVGHGDSDKLSSASRFSAIYDYLLVADENARRRYMEAGVEIPNQRFLIMGAPTLPGLRVSPDTQPIKNLLYAPTFEGKTPESNFSSIMTAGKSLLSHSLADTILYYRPHAATGVRVNEYKEFSATLKQKFNSGKQLDGKVDQFNWADAIISDMSGVTSEFLFTGKPIILPVSSEDHLAKSALKNSELRKIAYIWDYTEQNINNFILSIRDDPLREARMRFRNIKFNNCESFEDSSVCFNNALQGIIKPTPQNFVEKIAKVSVLSSMKNNIEKTAHPKIEMRKYINPNSIEYGLLRYSSHNIGDEIQSLAALRFLPRVDRYIPRERLDNIQSDKRIKAILNGWWMWQPKHFPPASCIDPFLISMHMREGIRPIFSQSQNIEYLKKHGPVGCRDLSTLNFLHSLNIPAYFSGCLTLTLQANPEVKKQDFILAITVPRQVVKEIKKRTGRPVYTFSPTITPYFNSIQRFKLAKIFLYLYQSAHCVVSSRLHAMLPCLAFGTPFLLIDMPERQSQRYDGFTMHKVSVDDFLRNKSAFNFDSAPVNPEDHLKLREELIKCCTEFTGHNSNISPVENSDPLFILMQLIKNANSNKKRFAWFIHNDELKEVLDKKTEGFDKHDLDF